MSNDEKDKSKGKVNDEEQVGSPKPKFEQLPVPNYHFNNEYKMIIHSRSTKPVEGLHSSIRKHFYSHYSFDQATVKPSTKNKKMIRSLKTNEKYKPVAKYCRTLRGAKNRGTRVDNQLDQLVNLMKENENLPLSHFLRPESKSPAKRFNPHTKAIMKALHDLNLRPLESQYCVGYGRCGTMIDLICQKLSTNELVAVEVKTGNPRRDYYHTGHRLERPFTAFTDCLASQYQLQLAAGIGLYNKSLGESGQHKRITDGYVIKANVAKYDNEVIVTRLKSDFMMNISKILQTICF